MKLIASDYDGTIKYDAEGLKKDIDAIQKWRAAGNVFAVISGRNAPQIRDIVANNKIPADYVLGDSGNTCYCNLKVRYTFESDGKVLPDLKDLLLLHNTLYIVVDNPLYITVIFRKKDGVIICDRCGEIGNFASFTQVSAFFENEEICRAAADDINIKSKGSVTALQNGDCLDIVPLSRTKAENIGYLADNIGIERKNIYTIGDNYNDIHMIRAFNGFAVENAPAAVKEKALCGVVPSLTDMIYEILKKDNS